MNELRLQRYKKFFIYVLLVICLRLTMHNIVSWLSPFIEKVMVNVL